MKGLLIALILLSLPIYAHAEQIPSDKAVKAIIGESLSDYDSMYAIACAIRNRDTLQGVYGVYSKQVPLASDEVIQRAFKAWYLSEEGTDVVKGATHWLSDYDLKHCNPAKTAFRHKMQETAYIGQTHFYKER